MANLITFLVFMESVQQWPDCPSLHTQSGTLGLATQDLFNEG